MRAAINHRAVKRGMKMDGEVLGTADMFAVDKRLGLKPVVDCNAFLRQAFADGPCTCVRCVESGSDQSAYEAAHTFDLDGVVSRRFAQTTSSDVLQVLKKAWLAYYKTEMRGTGELDLNALNELIEPALRIRVRALVLASGLASEDGERLMLRAVVE
jgi:hypothetical protein